VTFAYNHREPVLRDVSFTVKPGPMGAVIGATGASKSSLVHLVPCFYDVTEGRVTIGGADVRDLRQRELRSWVGMALREAILFSGTVAANLRHGLAAASDEDIRQAAAAAQFCSSLRDSPSSSDFANAF
jgi:ATP-binding cassette subfamily B protein